MTRVTARGATDRVPAGRARRVPAPEVRRRSPAGCYSTGGRADASRSVDRHIGGSHLTNEPSGFWGSAGTASQRRPPRIGFDQVKRRQALRYFTWRWSFTELRRSEQMRFLLSHTSVRTWLTCALGRTTSRTRPGTVSHGAADIAGCTCSRPGCCGSTPRPATASTCCASGAVAGGSAAGPLAGPTDLAGLANSALEVDAIGRGLVDGRRPSILEVGGGLRADRVRPAVHVPGARVHHRRHRVGAVDLAVVPGPAFTSGAAALPLASTTPSDAPGSA